jgi:hypothetical protein
MIGKNSFFGLLIILPMALAACAPDPVFRLQTHEDYTGSDNTIMHKGMEYLVSDLNESGAILAYYRHMGDRVIMDLEVFNYSDEVVRFDPGDVTYAAYSLDFDWNEKTDSSSWVRNLVADGSAIDPETTLMNIDVKESREDASERTGMLLDGISAGLTLASDISNAGKLTRSEIREREAQRTRAAIDRAERRDRYYRTISSLNSQRQYWENETIRTTDIYPGESLAGEISLPLAGKAQEIEITVAIGNEEHTFFYRQKRIDP